MIDFAKNGVAFLLVSSCLISQDLTLVMPTSSFDSLSRVGLNTIEMLYNDLSISILPTSNYYMSHHYNMPFSVKRLVIKKPQSKVLIMFEMLTQGKRKCYRLIPRFSGIKIAYSMLESSKIPTEWVNILNKNFDLVLVPSAHLVQVYMDSGVVIPIFELQVPINITYIKNFKFAKRSGPKFRFGTIAENWPRKNIEKSILAFAKAFGNNNDVEYVVHMNRSRRENLDKLISSIGLSNVKIEVAPLSYPDYIKFLSTINCYLLLSKGEGFSITPREALALGIPSVLSYNTGHLDICDSGFAMPVVCKDLKQAKYAYFPNEDCGVEYDCSVDDAADSLLNMFFNYESNIKNLDQVESWLNKYSYDALRHGYLTFVKPQKIILSDHNEFIPLEKTIITSSKNLFDKYKSVFRL